jgi:hypothetical protein
MLIAIHPSRSTGSGQMDRASAIWNGRTFEAESRSGAICMLARQLVEAGCPDEPWEAVRNGQVALHGKSLHGVAKLTVREPDKGRASFAKYVPREFAEYQDAA